MIAQIINALLGVFLMAAPGIFSLQQPAADNFHIFGPVITTFAVVAWWEATRTVRLWNVPLGVWLVVSPIFLSYGDTTAIIVAFAVGAAVAGLSFIEGKREKRYGGGWTALWRDDTLHHREAAARNSKTSDAS